MSLLVRLQLDYAQEIHPCSWIDDADMWVLVEWVVSLISEAIGLIMCVLLLAKPLGRDLPARSKSSHESSFELPCRSKDPY